MTITTNPLSRLALNSEVEAVESRLSSIERRLGRPSRENAESKGRRYLVEGRLSVAHYGPDKIQATCKGTEKTHALGYERGSWWCSCPARGRCSHLVALQLVAPRPGRSDV